MIQSKYILSFTLYGILVFSNISFSWAESEKKTQFSLDSNTLYLCKITKHITLNDNGVIFEHENKAFNLLISEEKKYRYIREYLPWAVIHMKYPLQVNMIQIYQDLEMICLNLVRVIFLRNLNLKMEF